MKHFQFVKNKYGKELLMDIGSYNDISNYFFEPILHTTDFYEIIFFSKGNGFLELDNQKINVENNTVIFISPFQNRKWHLDKSKIECHFLFFKDDFLSNFFSDKLFSFKLQYFYNKTKPLFIKISNTHLLKFQVMFQDILLELKDFKSDSEHIIRSLLYFTLIKLNRFYSEIHLLSSETENNTTSFMFKQLLQSEIRNNRTIDFYSQKLGVSRITLNKCVKKQFGMTCSEMIDEFIMFEIKSMLAYSTLNISEIANLFNFSESNHLTRFFKRHSNITPKEYRNNYQNGSNII
ncbi:AraC family transcriptional regulator [Flavobacterium sp. FlaQc-28]|mgnify:CR=1 FL=1|uniref:AraC family transcriptional regulator n=1 Tax=Flavobacterium sp. FlaQc-28 TaxID=3374178 RepID=UPI0037572F1D